MKNRKILTPLALTTLVTTSTLLVAPLSDSLAMGFDVIGSGQEIRSKMAASIDGDQFLGHHEKTAEEAKCGEGSCGDDKDGTEGKCGEESACGAKDGAEGKCGEGKCGS